MTAYERYAICKQCPEFNPYIKICGQCKCFMLLKTSIPKATCPLGKW